MAPEATGFSTVLVIVNSFPSRPSLETYGEELHRHGAGPSEFPGVIAVLADTHMPRGARRLPERCVELTAAADAVIHAGDFFALSVLEELRELCPVVHAVHGNVDEEPLRSLLPGEAEVEVGPSSVAIIHDAGPAKGRLARLAQRFPAADAVVFGHSHLPLHEEESGFQIFNPGSPTERRRAPRPSMGLLTSRRDGLVFEHVWL